MTASPLKGEARQSVDLRISRKFRLHLSSELGSRLPTFSEYLCATASSFLLQEELLLKLVVGVVLVPGLEKLKPVNGKGLSMTTRRLRGFFPTWPELSWTSRHWSSQQLQRFYRAPALLYPLTCELIRQRAKLLSRVTAQVKMRSMFKDTAGVGDKEP